MIHNHTLQSQSRPTVRAALYIRVSTQEQADRWGLKAQRTVLTKLAQDRGWDPIFYDEGGASGETIAGRPVFQRLLADVAAQRIDLVAVVEMERLTRGSDLQEWGRISTTFREAGVPVATPERVFNLDAAEDDFEADLRGILSKREKRKLLERTQRGLSEARNAGRFCGGQPPTGYTFDHATRKVVPDPETIPLVKRIFESESSDYELEKELRREGLSLVSATIHRIRHNPFYIGLRPDTKGQLVPADWQAIISQELWEKQQNVVRPRKTWGSTYLLSGIVRCQICGGPVVARPIRPSKKGTPLFVYACYYKRRCQGGMLPGWLVDMLVVDALEQYVQGPPTLKQRLKDAVARKDEIGTQDLPQRRRNLKAKAQDIEEREKRLVDSVESGVMPEYLVKKRLTDLAKERRSLQEEIDSLQSMASIPSLPDVREALDLAQNISTGSGDQHRRLLKQLAAAIELQGRERILRIKWAPGGESVYRVPQFRGGPGRSVEESMEVAREQLAEFRTITDHGC